MKIGFDLRFLRDDIYSNFVFELVNFIIKNDNENSFVVYTNLNKYFIHAKNTTNKKVSIENGTFAEQTKFRKILNQDKNGLMIFFNHYKPIFYSGEYFILIGDLKELFYSDFKTNFAKYKFLYLMEKNIKKANKIICLDSITKSEIIERFNIIEQNINVIDGFFPEIKGDFEEDEENLKISVTTKFGLKNPYFIFSAGDSIEKNYEKLIKVFSRLKQNGYNIDLVFLGKDIGKNLGLRNLILNNKLQDSIYFLGSPRQEEIKFLYRESLAVIFPSLYEPFPFKLTEPIYFKAPILASNLRKIESIFENKISYFSPISVSSIYDAVEVFIKKPTKNPNSYAKILQKYNVKNTADQILELI